MWDLVSILNGVPPETLAELQQIHADIKYFAAGTMARIAISCEKDFILAEKTFGDFALLDALCNELI